MAILSFATNIFYCRSAFHAYFYYSGFMEDERVEDLNADLGSTIRSRRTGLGLSLEALAGRSGVSRAMLSAVERGAKNPTIKVICQIAEALGCTVSALLGEPEHDLLEMIEVVREGEHPLLIDPRTGAERRLLAPAFVQHGIEILRYTIPAGSSTGTFPPHRRGVYEHVTVVTGSVVCYLGEKNIDLAVGDSASFPGDVAHSFRNREDEPAQYFLVIDSTQSM